MNIKSEAPLPPELSQTDVFISQAGLALWRAHAPFRRLVQQAVSLDKLPATPGFISENKVTRQDYRTGLLGRSAIALRHFYEGADLNGHIYCYAMRILAENGIRVAEALFATQAVLGCEWVNGPTMFQQQMSLPDPDRRADLFSDFCRFEDHLMGIIAGLQREGRWNPVCTVDNNTKNYIVDPRPLPPQDKFIAVDPIAAEVHIKLYI